MNANRKKNNIKSPGKDRKRNKEPGKLFSSKYYLILFSCLVVTLISYIPAFSNGWTPAWDDGGYVTANKLTQNLSFASFGNFFSAFQMGNYHPLAMLSLAIDYRLFGTQATGYHIHSVLLHMVNVALVFLFINQLTNKLWVSAVTALMFGIHPAHVESVGWISERKDLLYVLYYLASLIAYLKYIKGDRKRFSYIITLLLFMLSLLAKGQAVTLPVVLLLIDYYIKRPFDRKLWIEKIPFFVASLLLGIVAVFAQQNAQAFTQVTYSFPERVLFASYSFIAYLYKAILPIPLSSFYTYPHSAGNHYSRSFILFPLLFILFLFVIIYSIRRNRAIFFGLTFFMVNTILILQLLPVGSAMMADRYTYLSYVGLFFIIGILVEQLINSSHARVAKLRIPGIGFLILIFIFLSFKTFSRNKIWNNSESLYRDMLSYDANNPTANCKLATVYRDEGILDSAATYYSRAINELPTYTEALMNRGVVESVAGKYELAMNDFNRALKLDTSYAMVYGDRGNLNDMKGNYDAALIDYNKALHFDSSYHDAYGNRGRTYLHKGMVDEAVKDLTLSIKYQPDNAQSYLLRSDAYNTKGSYRLALSDALAAQSRGQQVNAAYIEMLEKKVNGH